MMGSVGLAWSRRWWIGSVVAAVGAAEAGRSGGWNLLGATDDVRKGSDATRGRLGSRPGRNVDEGAVGTLKVATGKGRDSLLYVPGHYRPDRPAPLAVMLHGAGGSAANGLGLLRPL